MGQKHSHESHRHQEEGAAQKIVEATVKASDVMICFASSDSEMASYVADKLDARGLTVWKEHAADKAPPGVSGKALMQTKAFVFVVSEESACSSYCEDVVSFAYISNKPIVAAAVNEEDTIQAFLNAGLRLTLAELPWVYFDDSSRKKQRADELIKIVSDVTEKTKETTSDSRVEIGRSSYQSTIRRQDLFTTQAQKSKAAIETSTILEASEKGKQMAVDEAGKLMTFWERSFGDVDCVPWFKFQQSFLNEYQSRLQRLLSDDNTQWLLRVLQNEIFDGEDQASREKFMTFRGDSKEKHVFWKRASQMAIEKYNMHQVFDMESSVRLTAVENLSKFSSNAVIDALLKLLDDSDPNIRAVAAISLARTEVFNAKIIGKLRKSLRDPDRLVRESGCLALGHLKAEKAVPDIVSLWRNDAISHVRGAAEVALTNIGGEEAEKAIHMTKVLSDEMKVLGKSRTS